MNEPLVSVIIPVYKVEKYLDRCIDSVVNQSYRNLEIILVNDGSPDCCPQICDEWANEDCRIKVIHKENGGVSSARNAGLDVCTGEYICFVDSDDWVDSTIVQALLDACVENNALLSVCGRYDHFEGNDYVKVNKCPLKNEIVDTQTFTAHMLIGNNCDSCAWGKMYHKSLWDKVRFPNGRIYEDIAVIYKVTLRVPYIATINKPLYHYFRRLGSIVSSSFSEKLFDYPFNTRNMLEDIKQNCPKLFEYACWSHLKAIQNVLHKLFVVDNVVFRKYKIYAKELSNEIKNYKVVYCTSLIFNKNDRILCKLYSNFFVSKMACRLNKKIKKIRAKINH